MFFFDFGASIYFFFFNLFLSGHGYSEAQLGVLTSTMAAGNLAGALPAGRLVQRWGLRNALIACTIAGPAVLCARSLSPVFPFQVGLAFLTGVALCLWAVCIAPTIAAITPESERPLAFSLVFSLGIGMGAAGALAGSRMPAWLAHASEFSGGLAPDQLTLIAGCLIAALAVIPAMALRTQRTVVPPRPGSLFSPAVRRVLPAVAIWALVAGSFFPFANVFLAVHLRLPLRSVGTVFSVSQLCQVAAVLCAPLVLRRLGISNGVFSMQIAVAFCFMLLALNSHPVAASVTYVALTAAQYMGEPGIYSLMMNIVPEEGRGQASASMALVLGAAQLIAAACAGWAFTNLGYPLAFGIIALIALCAGFLFKTVVHTEAHGLVPIGSESPAD